MVQTLTQNQQRVLRALDGWCLADLLVNPKGFSAPIGGRSHCDALGNTGDWIGFDGYGIRVGPLGGEVRCEVKWPAAKRHAASLPSDLIDRLVANRNARQKQMSSYRRWFPAEEDQETWTTRVLEPHEVMTRYYKGELDDLLDEAFPLADDLCRCDAIGIAHLTVPGLCGV